MAKERTHKDVNTGSGTQTPPPRPQDPVAGNTIAHRPDTDSGKDLRLNGAAGTRPSMHRTQESGMNDFRKP